MKFLILIAHLLATPSACSPANVLTNVFTAPQATTPAPLEEEIRKLKEALRLLEESS